MNDQGRGDTGPVSSTDRPEPRSDVDSLLAAARRGEADSLDELAENAHLSRFHLSRLLKEHLGFPLRDFLAAARVDRGIDVLVEGHSVTRSQVEAGHDSASSYTRAFAKHTGMAPSAYRSRLGSLAAHLMRHQDDEAPLVVLHRGFRAEDHPQRHALTVRVEGAAERGALFVALHPDPLVKGKPLLGVALLGTHEIDVTAIPDGDYYAMVVEVPRASSLRSYFKMDANRRQLERTPVRFPLAAPTVLTLALRDLIETDPPITINLPQIFFESLVGRVEVEVSNSGQPVRNWGQAPSSEAE